MRKDQRDYSEIHPMGAHWGMPDDRKDGRHMLLWEGDRPVIGRWDDGRKSWEDPESMHLFEAITYWSDINSPE